MPTRTHMNAHALTTLGQFVNWMDCNTDPGTKQQALELLSYMQLVATDAWPMCSGAGDKMRSSRKQVGVGW